MFRLHVSILFARRTYFDDVWFYTFNRHSDISRVHIWDCNQRLHSERVVRYIIMELCYACFVAKRNSCANSSVCSSQYRLITYQCLSFLNTLSNAASEWTFHIYLINTSTLHRRNHPMRTVETSATYKFRTNVAGFFSRFCRVYYSNGAGEPVRLWRRFVAKKRMQIPTFSHSNSAGNVSSTVRSEY